MYTHGDLLSEAPRTCCQLTNVPYSMKLSLNCVKTNFKQKLMFIATKASQWLGAMPPEHLGSTTRHWNLKNFWDQLLLKNFSLYAWRKESRTKENKGKLWQNHDASIGWRKGISQDEATLNSEEIKLQQLLSYACCNIPSLQAGNTRNRSITQHKSVIRRIKLACTITYTIRTAARSQNTIIRMRAITTSILIIVQAMTLV